VSLAFGSAQFTDEIPSDATVGDLRAWAILQVSGHCRFTVAATGADLTDDEALTLAGAGFVPSRAIRAEPIEQLSGEAALPSLATAIETDEVWLCDTANGHRTDGCAGLAEPDRGWLNPWP
jgi:hypothetical protein